MQKTKQPPQQRLKIWYTWQAMYKEIHKQNTKMKDLLHTAG